MGGGHRGYEGGWTTSVKDTTESGVWRSRRGECNTAPKSHLIFDCELKGVAGNALEEALVQIKPVNLLALLAVIANVIYLACDAKTES